jgi:hypothetical protein
VGISCQMSLLQKILLSYLAVLIVVGLCTPPIGVMTVENPSIQTFLRWLMVIVVSQLILGFIGVALWAIWTS